jgi:hypothetical protein
VENQHADQLHQALLTFENNLADAIRERELYVPSADLLLCHDKHICIHIFPLTCSSAPSSTVFLSLYLSISISLSLSLYLSISLSLYLSVSLTHSAEQALAASRADMAARESELADAQRDHAAAVAECDDMRQAVVNAQRTLERLRDQNNDYAYVDKMKRKRRL